MTHASLLLLFIRTVSDLNKPPNHSHFLQKMLKSFFFFFYYSSVRILGLKYFTGSNMFSFSLIWLNITRANKLDTLLVHIISDKSQQFSCVALSDRRVCFSSTGTRRSWPVCWRDWDERRLSFRRVSSN